MSPKEFINTDRAHTPEQKREVIERILGHWLQMPDMRLNQMLNNAARVTGWHAENDLFHMEDFDIVKRLDEWNSTNGET